MDKRSELARSAMALLVSASIALGGVPSYAFADDGAAAGAGTPVEAGAPDAGNSVSDGGYMIVVDGQDVPAAGAQGAAEKGAQGAPEEVIAKALEDSVA